MNSEMDTASTISIKGILSLLVQNADENNGRRLISLGMGDPSAYSCFHTTRIAQDAVVDCLESEKFNGYAPTVGLPQSRRFNFYFDFVFSPVLVLNYCLLPLIFEGLVLKMVNKSMNACLILL